MKNEVRYKYNTVVHFLIVSSCIWRNQTNISSTWGKVVDLESI